MTQNKHTKISLQTRELTSKDLSQALVASGFHHPYPWVIGPQASRKGLIFYTCVETDALSRQLFEVARQLEFEAAEHRSSREPSPHTLFEIVIFPLDHQLWRGLSIDDDWSLRFTNHEPQKIGATT